MKRKKTKPQRIDWYLPLFKHMAMNHDLYLLDSEIDEICDVVIEMRNLKRKTKCQS